MANKIILNLNNGYIPAEISSQEDYAAKSSYLFIKQNEAYIPASGYEAGTSYYEIDWQPLPTLQGYSVNLVAATPTTDTAGRTGIEISLYDEQSSTTNTFDIWNGKDGIGQVNTVDEIGITSGGNNVDLKAVRYGSNQNLTDSQKIQARKNIGAAPSDLSINGETLDSNGTLTLTPANFTYDTALDSNSPNPVQNSVLNNKFTEVSTSIAAINSSITAANASITAITPKIATITVASSAWDSGVSDVYTASVALPTGISLTSNTRADMYPNAEVMTQMINDGIIGLYLENDNQQLKMKAVGQKPTANLTNIQVSFVETIT